MENQNSDYVRARATFMDKTKSGDDQITLILGEGDLAQLIEKLQAANASEGVRVQVFMKAYQGKTLGSLKISDGTRKGGAPSNSAPKPAAFQPKSFAFKKK
jgi:hypothetical protein